MFPLFLLFQAGKGVVLKQSYPICVTGFICHFLSFSLRFCRCLTVTKEADFSWFVVFLTAFSWFDLDEEPSAGLELARLATGGWVTKGRLRLLKREHLQLVYWIKTQLLQVHRDKLVTRWRRSHAAADESHGAHCRGWEDWRFLKRPHHQKMPGWVTPQSLSVTFRFPANTHLLVWIPLFAHDKGAAK